MSGGKSLNIASKAILISTHLEFSSQQRKKFICQNGSYVYQTKGNVRNKFWKSVALLLAVPSQMTIWTNQSVLFQRSHVKLKNYDIAFWAKYQSSDKVAKDHLRPHKR